MLRTCRLLLFILLIVSLSSISASAQLNFTSTTYFTPAPATSVVSGDFDRDGLPDLAVGLESSTIRIYHATAPGQYGSFTDYAVGPDKFPNEMVVADFNGDGAPDIAFLQRTAASYAPSISFLWNNGDGTFRPYSTTTDLGLVLGGHMLVGGDFNNDGRVDLAALDCPLSGADCQVDVYLSNGNGTFRLSDTPRWQTMTGLVAIDLNKDGKVDLATTSFNPARGVIFLGNGDGTFAAPTTFDIPNTVPANAIESAGVLAAGDVNDDAAIDLIFLVGYNCGSACGQMNAHVFINDGSGGFSEPNPAFPVFTSGAGGTLLLSDLDGDLKQDLIYWNGSRFAGTPQFFHGAGDGTFTHMSSNLADTDLSGLIVRDLNLDSRHDLVRTSWLGTLAVVSLNNTGAANCAPPGSSTIAAKICTPHSDDTSTSFTVSASGNSASGVARLELWVDGVKKYQTWNDQLLRSVTVTAGAHVIEVVAVDRYANFAKTSVTVTSESGGGPCTAAENTVHLCAPVNGTTLAAPVEFSGAANAPNIALLRLYVDDQPVFETEQTSFNTKIDLGGGSHHAVLVAYTGIGDLIDQSFFTVEGTGGTVGCGTPATDQTILICSPAEGATVSSQFQLTARARWDNNVISHMRVYVDDQPAYDQDYPPEGFINPTLSLGAGPHRIVIVAWNNAGSAIVSPTRNITVQ
jgi:FG-GAP-like repeat